MPLHDFCPSSACEVRRRLTFLPSLQKLQGQLFYLLICSFSGKEESKLWNLWPNHHRGLVGWAICLLNFEFTGYLLPPGEFKIYNMTQICLKKAKFSKNVLNFQTYGENWLHYHDVHEALYQNSEIHGPWIRVSGPKAGPKWPYNEHVINLTIIFSISTEVDEKLNELL